MANSTPCLRMQENGARPKILKKSLQNCSESHLGVTGISGVGKHLATIPINTVDGSEIRRSPVEVGSLYSHYIRGILAPSKRWLVVCDF